MARADTNPSPIHPLRRPLWRRVLTALLVLLGIYLILRAAVQPFSSTTAIHPITLRTGVGRRWRA